MRNPSPVVPLYRDFWFHSKFNKLPPEQALTWLCMLHWSDKQGAVISGVEQMCSYGLGSILLTPDKMLSCQKSLAKPDGESRCDLYGGRSILKMGNGWWIPTFSLWHAMYDQDLVYRHQLGDKKVLQHLFCTMIVQSANRLKKQTNGHFSVDVTKIISQAIGDSVRISELLGTGYASEGGQDNENMGAGYGGDNGENDELSVTPDILSLIHKNCLWLNTKEIKDLPGGDNSPNYPLDVRYLNKERICADAPEKSKPEPVPQVGAEEFTPPTIGELKTYIRENKKFTVDAETFLNYYESVNWVVGWNKNKKKMTSWKSAVAGWHSRNICRMIKNNKAKLQARDEEQKWIQAALNNEGRVAERGATWVDTRESLLKSWGLI